MLLSICIPTFNRPLNLANCLNSLYQQKNVGKKDFEKIKLLLKNPLKTLLENNYQ